VLVFTLCTGTALIMVRGIVRPIAASGELQDDKLLDKLDGDCNWGKATTYLFRFTLGKQIGLVSSGSAEKLEAGSIMSIFTAKNT
jgi:hypothetical protein